MSVKESLAFSSGLLVQITQKHKLKPLHLKYRLKVFEKNSHQSGFRGNISQHKRGH